MGESVKRQGRMSHKNEEHDSDSNGMLTTIARREKSATFTRRQGTVYESEEDSSKLQSSKQ